ncbi:MAG: RNA pseudouridine synthase [Erysipelotrichaceae bacterium]|nr:RNA pseudouridine synthase [Erysipelotrichaceae bacterium]
MIKIISLNDDYVVCLKPVGLSSQDDGMGKELTKQLSSEIYCVHRLDKAVSGLMVFARNKKTAALLSGNISNKHYLAVVENKDLHDEDEFNDLLYHDKNRNKSYVVKRERKGVKDAKLRYKVVKRKDDLCLVDVELFTGRTHQIRVQFASRKMPLLGDGKYGSKVNCDIALFSYSLSFRDPVSNELLTFKTEVENIYPFSLFN